MNVIMNEIVNKFLLAGDKYMPEMHFRQPGFTYSACGPFTKKKELIQKFKETGDTTYIYEDELNKACFQHDMADEYFKDLTKRAFADKILRDKAFKLQVIRNMMDIKEDWLLWYINFWIKSHKEVVILYLLLYKLLIIKKT